MKKWSLLIVLVTVCSLVTVACGGGKSSGPSTPVKGEDRGMSRINFSIDDNSNATYKQHIADLWQKTKLMLRDDAAGNLTDEQLLQVGKEVKQAWVDLQVHGSLHHKAKLDSAEEDTKDHKLGNMTGNVIGLIDDLYGWPAYTKEKREEVRSNLRKGRLEYKIKEFDAILKAVEVN
jgi:hypothetical protein